MKRLLVVAAAVSTIALLVGVQTSGADSYGTTRAEASSSEAAVKAVFRPYGRYVENCMVRVMWRESGGNPRAANYHDSNGGSYNLLQLNGAIDGVVSR